MGDRETANEHFGFMTEEDVILELLDEETWPLPADWEIELVQAYESLEQPGRPVERLDLFDLDVWSSRVVRSMERLDRLIELEAPHVIRQHELKLLHKAMAGYHWHLFLRMEKELG